MNENPPSMKWTKQGNHPTSSIQTTKTPPIHLALGNLNNPRRKKPKSYSYPSRRYVSAWGYIFNENLLTTNIELLRPFAKIGK